VVAFAYVLGLMYLAVGYAILVFVAYKYYIFLCIRWGVDWGPALNPLAFRAALLASIPLVGVGLMIGLNVLGGDEAAAQAGIVAGFAAMAGLTAYQAWALSRQYKAEMQGRTGGPHEPPGSPGASDSRGPHEGGS
jgi:hypothetical protein